jgi:hypothetical protein
MEWAARLPSSSGKVGMYGFSYVGAPSGGPPPSGRRTSRSSSRP